MSDPDGKPAPAATPPKGQERASSRKAYRVHIQGATTRPSKNHRPLNGPFYQISFEPGLMHTLKTVTSLN